ncbi:MAG: DUF6446 family protein [Pseudomonadota bacterium]
MSGRLIAGGLVAFALLFGAALWWFQTRGHYQEVVGLDEVVIAGVATPVVGYRGIDAVSSPLKLRGCFTAEPLTGPPAPEAEPLIAPAWFDCFDAEALATDIAAGAATAILAEFNTPYGFDRIVAAYPDGRAFQWRQINKCGSAHFEGDPPPEGCPPKDPAKE